VITGRIFNIQRFSVQDGPGIRTTVFMKGCPLACPWCSNPESKKKTPELGHIDALCDGCGRCAEVCDRKAITAEAKRVTIDRGLCDDCGRCVEVCAPGALKIFGREVTVDEVFAEVRKDELYYRNSGGGVTASGGEPLAQPAFVTALFERSHEAGIHTTLDTCGLASRAAIERVLQCTDLVLFDLKLIDPATHAAITKGSNTTILNNARLLVERGIPLIIRIPLIPAHTDTEENVAALVQFVGELGAGVMAVNLLPYHRFGLSKYEMLDQAYALRDMVPPPRQRVEAIAKRFETLAVDCEIVT
jgi:pyruvate formate lyase activating enzyme